MLPLRSPSEVLIVDGVSFQRDGDGWEFSWGETDVNSMVERRFRLTTEAVISSGPAGVMSADELDTLARAIGRDPASLPWCRERRLLERVVADDLEGVRALLPAASPTTVHVRDARQSILTIAIGVAAWTAAADLILRGEPLQPPPQTSWDAGSYAIAALDDSDGAMVVLQHLLARHRFEPEGGLLRLARAPQIAHALIDAGADPDGVNPSNPTLGSFLEDATPVAAAVIRSNAEGKHRLDVAAALLDRGASLETRDVHGRTALIAAVAWGFEGPVRWLLEHGANANCKPDARGRTPKSLALENPDDPMSQLVLEALASRRTSS